MNLKYVDKFAILYFFNIPFLQLSIPLFKFFIDCHCELSILLQIISVDQVGVKSGRGVQSFFTADKTNGMTHSNKTTHHSFVLYRRSHGSGRELKCCSLHIIQVSIYN